MKNLISLLIFILFANLNLPGQNPPMIGVSFGTSSYTITDVLDAQTAIKGKLPDDLAFFYEHFSQTDYQKYRSYYYNNTCLASEDDFKNWRAHLAAYTVTPVARYLVYAAHDTMSIISYTLGSASEKQYAPLALQKKNNRWYLLDIKKSEQTMDCKMFLSFVNPTFVSAFLDQPTAMKEKYMATIFSSNGNLNGDLLMNYYEARYDPSSAKYALSEEVFHDVAIMSDTKSAQITTEIKKLADEYRIPADKKIILDKMSTGGNYNMAISKIAEWSGTTDIIEITDKFHSGLTTEVKKN